MATQSSATPGAGYGNPYIDALVWGCQWLGGPVTYAFGPGARSVDGLVSLAWTEAEKSMFRQVLDSYANVCNITFSEVDYSASANIVEWKFDFIPWSGSGIILGIHDVPDNTWTQNWGYYSTGGTWWNTTPGSLGWSTVVHEIGHGLGLAHPHDGGSEGSATTFPGVTGPAALGDFQLNQGIWTAMSYNGGWIQAESGTWSYGESITPMAFDVAALQAIYGANTTYRVGNDVYMLPTLNGSGTGWSCLWDAGGSDTISNEGSNRPATIDLRAAPLTGANAGGYVSRPLGLAGGFTIANTVVIENAIGGNAADILYGNSADNLLVGNGGADVFWGLGGNDTVHGGDGVDTLNVQGRRSDYTVTLVEEGIRLTYTQSGGDGIATAFGVEFVYFQQDNLTVSTAVLGDFVAPTLAAIDPVDGANNVAVDGNIVLTFDEAIQRGTGNVLLKTAGGEEVATYNIASNTSNLTLSGNTLTINPSANLAHNGSYVLEIGAGVIRDLAGNAFAGLNAYDFSTIAVPVSQVLFDGAGAGLDYGLYRLGNGQHVIDEAGLQAGDVSVAPLELRAGTRAWQPISGARYLAVYEDGGYLQLVYATGTGSRTVYAKFSFDMGTGFASPARATALGLAQLLALESRLDLDFNGDGVRGDAVQQVLFEGTGGGLGVYRLASGSYVVDSAGLEPGDMAVAPLPLVSGTRVWVPPSGAQILALAPGDPVHELVFRSGSGTRISYNLQRFDADTGAAVGRSQVLSLAQLLALEDRLDTDLNGDSGIGDSIQDVLYAGLSGGMGVYRLASGAHALDVAGLAGGDDTDAPLLLKVGTRDWLPVAGAQILAVAQEGGTYEVIYSVTGRGAPVYSLQAFNATSGLALTSRPVVLTPAQLAAKETSLNLDLNGDSIIGVDARVIFVDDIAELLKQSTRNGGTVHPDLPVAVRGQNPDTEPQADGGFTANEANAWMEIDEDAALASLIAAYAGVLAEASTTTPFAYSGGDWWWYGEV